MKINTQNTCHKPVDYDPFCGGDILLTVPSTEAQKEIWVSVQMGGDGANCAFNESVSLKLSGRLDVETLRSSFQSVVQRHESLRATFTPDGETLCINASLSLEIPLVDLTGMDKQLRDERLSDIFHQEVQLPFNLEHGPLIRGQIVKVNEREFFFIITAHHIICDGWSSAVLLKELGVIYSAIKQGVKADLEKPYQFSDYALLLESQAQSSEYSADEDYWLRKFQEKIPVLDLPTDRNRPPLRSYNAAREDRKLDRTLVVNLKNTGAKAGCTFFITLLAGLKVFLYRLSGHKDLVVGFPAAAQSVVGQDTLVGHCVNILPIRSNINGKQSFGEYLKTVRKEMMDAYDHQQFTFGSILKKLSLERDPSRIPLVPVVFNLDQGIDGKQLGFEGLDVEYVSNPRQFENFEIFINAVDTGGDVVLECQYNTDLFDQTTMARMLKHFQTMLEGIVADAGYRICDLPLLTKAERHQLMAWNETHMEYPGDICLHQLFEAQVERTPDSVALVTETKKLTYRELNNRANQVAQRIISLGVGLDIIVGVFLERSAEMIAAILGILKAGGAYMPLDPEYPKDRLAFILSDSQTQVLVTQSHLRSQLPEKCPEILCLDADRNVAVPDSTENPQCNVQPNNLAYLLYTSGSTGVPKGVAIEHHSPVALICWAHKVFSEKEMGGVLFSTSICFDLSVFEIFSPLTMGGEVILANNLLELPSLKAASEVTLINTVPSAIAELLRIEGIPPSVCTVNLAGELLKSSLVQKIYDVKSIQRVYDLYGPSEDTTYSTWVLRTSEGPQTIGRPISNTQVYILDQQRQLVPIGVNGELYLGGDGLARGYLHRPDLTAEKFITNPFKDSCSPRLYATGDLVRYLPDGNLVFMGRIDHQVKIRGFRIELGEIEAVLSNHPSVKDQVVVAHELKPGDNRIIAYIVPKNKDISLAELRPHLATKLPNYMIPSNLIELEALPLTPNGKVDRKALPAPDNLRPELEATYVPPRTPVEERIAAIWTEILGLEQVGVHDNFFDLGGHSLLSVRLVAQIEKVFGKKLPLAALFPAPTIEKLACMLHQDEEPAKWHSLVPLHPDGSHLPLFGIHSTRYHTLARYLGPEQPIYALRYGHASEISEDIMTLPEQLEDLASHYIVEMQTVQPEGPYFLIGLCIGALVAFEMAQQLVAQGAQVALLALADPIIRSGLKSLPLRTKASNLLQLGPVEALRRVQKGVIKKLRILNSETSNRAQDKYHTYVPKKVYPGKAYIFKSVGEVFLSSSFDPELGWGKLIAGGLEIHEIPSGHTELFDEPAVRVTAENLKDCLAQARADVLASR